MMEEETRLASKPTNLAQDNQFVCVSVFFILGTKLFETTLSRMICLVTTGLESGNFAVVKLLNLTLLR